MRILFALLLLLHTTVSGDTPSPDHSSLSSQILELKEKINEKNLSKQQSQSARHEIHRLMLLVYITNAHDIKRSARLHAQHTLSRLYYTHNAHQATIRDHLCVFIEEIVSNDHKDASHHHRSEQMLTNITLLEEHVLPLLGNDTETRELLYAFTQSMFGLVTKNRITRQHIFLVGCCVITGIAAIIVMLGLLNKIIEAKGELDRVTTRCMNSFDHVCLTIADKAEATKDPGIIKSWLLKTIGLTEPVRNAQARRDALKTRTPQ